jgi:hypothetical protein
MQKSHAPICEKDVKHCGKLFLFCDFQEFLVYRPASGCAPAPYFRGNINFQFIFKKNWTFQIRPYSWNLIGNWKLYWSKLKFEFRSQEIQIHKIEPKIQNWVTYLIEDWKEMSQHIFCLLAGNHSANRKVQYDFLTSAWNFRSIE